jgi:hypothetical protein
MNMQARCPDLIAAIRRHLYARWTSPNGVKGVIGWHGLWCPDKQVFVMYSAMNEDQLKEVLRDNSRWIKDEGPIPVGKEARIEMARKLKGKLSRGWSMASELAQKPPAPKPEPPNVPDYLPDYFEEIQPSTSNDDVPF